jgi:outer membrane protein OmpA-like peptidoglycan-associated protein
VTPTPTQNPRLDVNDTPTLPENGTQTPPLAAEVAPSTAITDSGTRLPTSPVIIYFATDRATLWPAAQTRLDEIAQVLGQQPGWVLRVAGHADARGSDDHNTQLSQRRVRRVREYLASRGVDESRVVGQAFGERVPIADGDDVSALHQNRRVEISFQRSQP